MVPPSRPAPPVPQVPARTLAAGRRTELSPAQQRILQVVLDFPGCTIQDVAAQCSCSHPTSAYHLVALARRGLVRCTRDGRSRRHYAVGAGPAAGESQYLAALERDGRRKLILDFLRTEPLSNVSINQIRSRLGLPYGLIKRTLQQLERQGLVALHPGRYTYGIELKGPWARQAAPKPAPAVVSVQVRSVVATEAYPAIANP